MTSRLISMFGCCSLKNFANCWCRTCALSSAVIAIVTVTFDFGSGTLVFGQFSDLNSFSASSYG